MNDSLIMACFGDTAKAKALLASAPTSVEKVSRSLSKRGVLQFEKLAHTVLENAGAYTPEKKPFLEALKFVGLCNSTLEAFQPVPPPGVDMDAWLADLRRRVSYLTNGASPFDTLRGRGASDNLRKRYPAIDGTYVFATSEHP